MATMVSDGSCVHMTLRTRANGYETAKQQTDENEQKKTRSVDSAQPWQTTAKNHFAAIPAENIYFTRAPVINERRRKAFHVHNTI